MIDPTQDDPSHNQASETRQQKLRRPYLAAAVFGALVALCIAVAALGGRLFAWPFSYAVPLISQIFCYVALCDWLARLTPLYPDHPAHRHVVLPEAIIASMERMRHGLTVVDRVGAGLCAALGALMLIVVGLPPANSFLTALAAVQPIAWAASSVFLALTMALLIHSSDLAGRNTAQMYTLHTGVDAMARVMGVQAMPFRVGPERKRPYLLDLELLLPDAPPVRVNFRQLIGIRKRRMPPVGATIRVKYLRHDPHMVVALLEHQADYDS